VPIYLTRPNYCCMSFINNSCTLWRKSYYKKAQLSLTNPRDAKVCQKSLQFDMLTTLSLTILAYLHSFSCCCVRNLRNPANSLKIQTYGVQGQPMSSILVSMESPYVTSYQSLIVGLTLAVSATVFEIFTVKDRKLLILHTRPLFDAL